MLILQNFGKQNKELKKEVNQLRKKLKMIEKYKEKVEIDEYDKMAQFLFKNNLETCNICKAIDVTDDNECCEDREWCQKGIARYLRDNKVLE